MSPPPAIVIASYDTFVIEVVVDVMSDFSG